jgi:uncharacterized membrane protein YesL
LFGKKHGLYKDTGSIIGNRESFHTGKKGEIEMNKLITILLPVMDRIWNMILLNILWLLFTVVGLGIFGILPATTAVFAIVRSWIMKKDTLNLFKEFWKHYRAEFKRANIFGLFVWVFAYFFYIDWKFVQKIDDGYSLVGYILLLSLFFIFSLILIYLFPLVVHYNISFGKAVKTGLLLALLNPIYSVLIIVTCILIYMLFTKIPSLIFLFGIIPFCWVVMKGTYLVFKRNDKKLALNNG